MLFSSMFFLWIFLPLVIAFYYGVNILPLPNAEKKMKYKNIVLLVASIIFYAFGGLAYLGLLLLVILVNYAAGIIIATSRPGKRKPVFVISLILNLGVLFMFKYLNLFVLIGENLMFVSKGHPFSEAWQNMLTLTRTGELSYTDIILPLGISFYTFQAISYVADVYMQKVKAKKSFLEFALYVSFFPQLIAGPIVQYSDIRRELRKRAEDKILFSEGISRFIYGLSKKVILSNTFGEIADQVWALDTKGIGAAMAWLGALSYTLQIYYDFSGYSDMAIGLGKMFGFHFKENFNYPYVATSIQDFWRRWHISLSSWFKEYVYIPLGGSRCKKSRLALNIFIVFLLTGIWHGANFTFLIWGIVYAILLIIERMFLGKLLQKNPVKILNRIYTLLFVILNWIMFRSDNCIIGFRFIGELFSKGNGEYTIFSYLSMQGILAFVFGILLATPIYKLGKEKAEKSETARFIWQIAETVVQILLLALCIVLLISGTYNPFIYFQF